jgi:threonine/homoserine/homoserine lactone efflux protein
MDNVILILSILALHVFAWFTPGPNLVLVIRNSLIYSRRTGFFTAGGFALSNLAHILLALAGIGLLLTAIPLVATIIKLVGVGYLIYLGINTFSLKPQSSVTIGETEKHRDISPLTAMKTGFITNFLSPKAPLFFASIFGSLLASSAPLWVIAFLTIAMPLNTLFMASMWSIFFSHHHVKKLYLKYQPLINKALGVILFIVAVSILFSK